MTKSEIVQALRGAGYDGPVSYSKDRLLELLEEVTRTAPVATDEVAAGAAAGVEGKVDEWAGLRKGDVVKVATDRRSSRRRYVFLYYFNDGQQEYAAVKDPSHGYIRTVAPSLVRTLSNRKVVQ